MTHSPSPWRAGKGGYVDRIYDAGDPPHAICELYYYLRSREEIEANRRLIEAAPELLAICERILAHEGSEPCRADHHGYCQAHNLEPVEDCWIARLRELVRRAGGTVPEE